MSLVRYAIAFIVVEGIAYEAAVFPPRQLSANQDLVDWKIDSTISEEAPQNDDGSRDVCEVVVGRQGDVITATFASRVFSPTLDLYRSAGGGPLAANLGSRQPGWPDTASIGHPLDEGLYVIQGWAYGALSAGRYTMNVRLTGERPSGVLGLRAAVERFGADTILVVPRWADVSRPAVSKWAWPAWPRSPCQLLYTAADTPFTTVATTRHEAVSRQLHVLPGSVIHVGRHI